MNDRELMELAAKAGGVDAEWHNEHDADYDAQGEGMWLKGGRTPDNDRYWNPLRKAGDTLRLALALNLTIKADDVCVEVESACRTFSSLCFCQEISKYGACAQAVTSVAAEIGRSMQ